MPLTDEQLDRYARHIILRDVGGAGQQKLLSARVLVIGAGGLGAPVLLYLAAAGVGGGPGGALGVVDFDAVDLSNLQRQVIHSTARLGRPKTESAGETIAALNPGINFVPHTERLTRDNAEALFASYDLIADGTDSFETRFLVNDAALKSRNALVSAAVSQFDGQVAVFKGYEAQMPCYRCFVPEAPPADAVPTCAEAGVLGALTGVVGSLQAMEVLKEILGIGTSLAGRLLLYDGLSAETRTVRLPKDPACPVCSGK